jgi:hypothetical protein
VGESINGEGIGDLAQQLGAAMFRQAPEAFDQGAFFGAEPPGFHDGLPWP